jgi:hypothetical protein
LVVLRGDKKEIPLPQSTMTKKIWLLNLVMTKIFDHPTLKKIQSPNLKATKKGWLPSVWQLKFLGCHKRLVCGIILESFH